MGLVYGNPGFDRPSRAKKIHYEWFYSFSRRFYIRESPNAFLVILVQYLSVTNLFQKRGDIMISDFTMKNSRFEILVINALEKNNSFDPTEFSIQESSSEIAINIRESTMFFKFVVREDLSEEPFYIEIKATKYNLGKKTIQNYGRAFCLKCALDKMADYFLVELTL